jgi:hypothetical protein
MAIKIVINTEDGLQGEPVDDDIIPRFVNLCTALHLRSRLYVWRFQKLRYKT